jgi:hypothetical protein
MWKINEGCLEFAINDLFIYSINIERLLKDEEMWIEHLNHKRWFNGRVKNSFMIELSKLKNNLLR